MNDDNDERVCWVIRWDGADGSYSYHPGAANDMFNRRNAMRFPSAAKARAFIRKNRWQLAKVVRLTSRPKARDTAAHDPSMAEAERAVIEAAIAHRETHRRWVEGTAFTPAVSMTWDRQRSAIDALLALRAASGQEVAK